MPFNLAQINDAIAVPEREAIVTPERRLTWRDLQARTRRLATWATETALAALAGQTPSGGPRKEGGGE